MCTGDPYGHIQKTEITKIHVAGKLTSDTLIEYYYDYLFEYSCLLLRSHKYRYIAASLYLLFLEALTPSVRVRHMFDNIKKVGRA